MNGGAKSGETRNGEKLMRKNSDPIWAYLLMAFIIIGMAAAVLPGCGDDTSDDSSDTDSGYESQYSPPPVG